MTVSGTCRPFSWVRVGREAERALVAESAGLGQISMFLPAANQPNAIGHHEVQRLIGVHDPISSLRQLNANLSFDAMSGGAGVVGRVAPPYYRRDPCGLPRTGRFSFGV